MGTPFYFLENNDEKTAITMDMTKSTTFTATLTYISTDEIAGSASTTILYGEYGVEVPLTQSASFVSDELTMGLDFVATATE